MDIPKAIFVASVLLGASYVGGNLYRVTAIPVSAPHPPVYVRINSLTGAMTICENEECFATMMRTRQ